jgi:CRP-like cAMP-binding protein
MWILIAAWVASLLVFSSFFMKTMVPLRLAAIASNVAFVSYALLGLAYGVFGRLYPILVLHASLLPLNVHRLRQLRRLTRAVADASDEDALAALVPYMKVERRSAGDVLFRKGDEAGRLYVLQEGSVLLTELGLRIAPGGLFGELGLFAPGRLRAATAVCEGDCRLATLDRGLATELAYQDPAFASFLVRLIAGYVQEDPTGRAASGHPA